MGKQKSWSGLDSAGTLVSSVDGSDKRVSNISSGSSEGDAASGSARIACMHVGQVGAEECDAG